MRCEGEEGDVMHLWNVQDKSEEIVASKFFLFLLSRKRILRMNSSVLRWSVAREEGERKEKGGRVFGLRFKLNIEFFSPGFYKYLNKIHKNSYLTPPHLSFSTLS